MSDNQRLREQVEAGSVSHPEGQQVFDANGDKIGTVIDHSDADQYIVVEKGSFFTKDIYIPTANITGQDAEGIHLNLAKGDFNDKKWQDAPDNSSTPTSYVPGASSAQTQQAAPMSTTQTVQDVQEQPARPAQPVQAATTATANDADDVRVPVYEEELVAGTREEEIGQVHLRKEVETAQETVPVTLRREEVTVERVPVNQDIDPNAATDAFQNADIDVPVMGEEAIVGKQVHEVEEVRLHKQDVTEQEQVSGTVRRERVVVDGEGAQGGAQATVSTNDRTS
jgi:uncharacterized protein (TIGR02271 family)